MHVGNYRKNAGNFTFKTLWNCLIIKAVYFQWLDNVNRKIAALGVFEDHIPNHVLVNEYLPGQGIMVCIDSSGLYYSPLRNSRIGEYRNRPGLSVNMSVCLPILAHSTKMDGWIFVMYGGLWYHDQVPWGADACKIELALCQIWVIMAIFS